jgi:glycosyltransferase involved in cell wall biosynthesis
MRHGALRMKLAVVLESDFSSGGGFQQGLNAALEIHRLVSGRFEVVFWTDIASNVHALEELGLQPRLFRRARADRLLALLELSELGRRISAKAELLDSLERLLLTENTDLAYFVSPSTSAARLKKIGFIATVWDLCHRDWPEFPEVRAASEYRARENMYADSLARAQLVISDSDQLADNIVRRYGVDRERVLPMPFGPSPLLFTPTDQPSGAVLQQYSLQPGYFFYPAQFWPHKNHVRIVQALAQLRSAGLDVIVAFAGSDKGNLRYVQTLVRTLDLDDRVRFLGMVPVGHMHELYAQSAGLVMPTYFGPTNLPPLEAWTMGKPLIYSMHLAAQAGDAAILVDPDSAESIAEAIRTLVLGADARDWRHLGRQRLSQLAEARSIAAAKMMQHLDQYERRRQCWP